MTVTPFTPYAARQVLDATIRSELWDAYQRGMDAAPHGVNATTDPGAEGAFATIAAAVDENAMAIIASITQLATLALARPDTRPSPGTVPGETSTGTNRVPAGATIDVDPDDPLMAAADTGPDDQK